MNSSRTYFLCPYFDYPVDSISLGHIIASPSDPSNALNVDEVVQPRRSDISEENTTGSKLDGRMLNSTQGGVLRAFLRVSGFGGDPERGRDDVFEFKSLDTMFFNPTHEYLRQASRAEGVQRFSAASHFKKPLYIITGVMIVRGAQSSRSPLGGEDRAEIPFEVATPIVVGAGVEVSSGWNSSKSFKAPLDFVLAFRLAKFRLEYPRKMLSQVQLGEPGAVLGDQLEEPGAFFGNELKIEDVRIGDVRAAVAEEIKNIDKKDYVIVYSAERPTAPPLPD